MRQNLYFLVMGLVLGAVGMALLSPGSEEPTTVAAQQSVPEVKQAVPALPPALEGQGKEAESARLGEAVGKGSSGTNATSEDMKDVVQAMVAPAIVPPVGETLAPAVMGAQEQEAAQVAAATQEEEEAASPVQKGTQPEAAVAPAVREETAVPEEVFSGALYGISTQTYTFGKASALVANMATNRVSKESKERPRTPGTAAQPAPQENADEESDPAKGNAPAILWLKDYKGTSLFRGQYPFSLEKAQSRIAGLASKNRMLHLHRVSSLLGVFNPPLHSARERDPYPFSCAPSTFTLHKLGSGQGPTLLVVGGIQGDEPGGFSAASLLATHYTIRSGTVWVVPDLNVDSIFERNRGQFGDLNRKFAALSKNDPEYELVQRIKKVLLDDRVDLILNLHDGSGFYRPTWENALRNPNRWGQSVIIDQKEMDAPRFNNLEGMAFQAQNDVNRALMDPDHEYFIRNTNTRGNDKEMEKSLSYFAVCNGKPAFGVEASKEFTTEYRSYYHVAVVESFMRQMGIDYTRNFPLKPEGILLALNSDLKLAIFNNKIVLPLDNVRPVLNNVPFRINADPQSKASRPLLGLVKSGGNWRVAYGNRTLTRINPEYMPFDDSLAFVPMTIDGKKRNVPLGDIVHVNDSFEVEDMPGYRVNAIGAVKDRNGSEAGINLVQGDFTPRFSVDRGGYIYRVELYKGQAFAGMVLVSFFDTVNGTRKESLTATKGPESDLGY